LVERAIDPAGSGGHSLRIAIGIALPLGLVGVACVLYAITGYGRSGQFDVGVILLRVAPLWLSSPVVAGFIWRRLTRRQTKLAALIFGTLVSSAAALAFWQWIGTPFDCGFGTITPAIDFLPQSIIVGVVVGGGLALSGLLVTELVRLGVRWWAVVIGASSEAVLFGLALFIGFAFLGGHNCSVAGPGY
jgi:hypothetical protein